MPERLIRRKQYELASFKALPDAGGQTGRFEAMVSVFSNVDLQGDRVMPGAFTKSLGNWRSSGDPIPIVWAHDWADPFAHIGQADPRLAQETPDGLKLVGQLDVHKPFAAQVYDLLKSRRVKEWSFAYDIQDQQQAKDMANNLIELDIIEAGPCLKGANPETDTLGVKAMLQEAKESEMKHQNAGNYVQSAHDALSKAGASCATKSKSRTKQMDMEPVDGSYEDTQEDIQEALEEVEGASYEVCIVATFDDHVIYNLTALDSDETESYSRTYSYDEATDEVSFGDRTSVDIATVVQPDSDPGKSARISSIKATGVDNGAWDGAVAMQTCKTAADFRSIAFERDNPAAPDTAAHWALPHHSRPAADPNAKGVSAALGALNGARGGVSNLKDTAGARTHLEAHETTIQNANKNAPPLRTQDPASEFEDVRQRLRILSMR